MFYSYSIDISFINEVMFSDKFYVVDFWSEWCGPCAAMRPVIEELVNEYAGKVQVGKINVDQNPYRTKEYEITSLPVIMFFRAGKPENPEILQATT
ncbi:MULTISPECIES: thioredoxin family protein [Chitinophaga]|nr:thioredoxin domain-containing protein [Chitinophaga varians]